MCRDISQLIRFPYVHISGNICFNLVSQGVCLRFIENGVLYDMDVLETTFKNLSDYKFLLVYIFLLID